MKAAITHIAGLGERSSRLLEEAGQKGQHIAIKRYDAPVGGKL